MVTELLHQVRVLNPVTGSDQIGDVLIEAGAIQAIAPQIPVTEEMVVRSDRPGLVLAPGLVDLYSHSGEPGYESRETLASLSRAAITGGFTRLAILPDTQPILDNAAKLDGVRHRSTLPHQPQLHFWGAMTLKAEGQQMTELAELAAAGVVGFTDGHPLQNWMLVRRVMEYAKPLGKPLAFWCCDRDLSSNGVVREGSESIRLGLPGSPAIAETIPLSALLECVRTLGTPVHLMRISTARSVALIRAAKAEGLPITASTSWMHLLLDITAVHGYNPNLRLEPPLGSREDRHALVQGLKDGTLDAIAIDHSPFTYEEKTVAFAEAPPGAIGLELALPLLWQGLVATGDCTALELWRSLSTQPARCLHQSPSSPAPGAIAELTLFDPAEVWTASRQSLQSLSGNTPWLGKEIQGKVLQTWTSPISND